MEYEGLLDRFAPTLLKPGEKGAMLPFSKTATRYGFETFSHNGLIL
jgi:hypothetical protein